MKDTLSFEEIKKILVCFLETQSIDVVAPDNDWQSDFSSNWDEEFNIDFDEFIHNIKVFDDSVKKGNKIEQIAALTRARTRLLNLSNFFENIFEDVERIAWSDEFEWPDIPENYKFPQKP